MKNSKPGTEKRFKSRLILIALWTTFTVSLAIWWYIYSVRQLERSAHLSGVTRAEALRERKMLSLEGIVLIVCLVGGGGALAYFVLKDLKQQRQLMDFFLTFTHELKTPLTNIQLQAENLADTLTDPADLRQAQNLLNETARLTLQLDNSLYLAREDATHALFLEQVALSELIRELSPEYPALKIRLVCDEVITADRAALLTILRNIARNALIHGNASELSIEIDDENIEPGMVKIICTDDGNGFRGESVMLGKPFARHSQTSGSGLGLYICTRLARLMNGDFKVLPQNNKLQLVLTLREAASA